MPRIPEQTIEDIRNRTDIVELIGRYVELKRAGHNHVGLCPFHHEKTPSFNVRPDHQSYHCFGCGVGGSAFDFLINHDSLTFPEAARVLARECGVEISEDDTGERGVTERIVAALEIAQQLYRAALLSPEGEVARTYLNERGLDRAAAEQFGIGYAPDAWDRVERALARAGIPAELGERAGLIKPRSRGGSGHYDHLRNRLVFPIADARGRIVGFGGRALSDADTAKYLNTPETPLFHKRRVLYGLNLGQNAIRRSERVVVCEGYFDRIALHRAGIEEAVATCGTALSTEHADQLRRRVHQVVLLFDGDEAGQRAVERALETLLPHGLRVRAAALPAGEDPDSFLVAHGADALRALVDAAPDALELAVKRAVACGIDTPAQKADAISQLVPLVALVPDPVERSGWVDRIATACRADKSAVQAVLRRAAAGESAPRLEEERVRPRLDSNSAEARHLRTLVQLLLEQPALAQPQLRERVENLAVHGPWRKIALAVLDGASRGFAALAASLDSDDAVLLREAAFDEALSESEASPEQMLDQILAWFSKRRLARESQDLTQRMRDPDADLSALMLAKQRQLEERRAADGLQK